MNDKISITIIQLFSEQTMQDLLLALALRPAKLIHLVTSKVAARSSHIAEPSRQAGFYPDMEPL
jgi:hypothetical protein